MSNSKTFDEILFVVFVARKWKCKISRHACHGYHGHQDRQENQYRQDRQIWHLNLTFQVSCVWAVFAILAMFSIHKCPLLTKSHQLPTGTASYWLSTIKYQPLLSFTYPLHSLITSHSWASWFMLYLWKMQKSVGFFVFGNDNGCCSSNIQKPTQ